jgi:hypothetical protein
VQRQILNYLIENDLILGDHFFGSSFLSSLETDDSNQGNQNTQQGDIAENAYLLETVLFH